MKKQRLIIAFLVGIFATLIPLNSAWAHRDSEQICNPVVAGSSNELLPYFWVAQGFKTGNGTNGHFQVSQIEVQLHKLITSSASTLTVNITAADYDGKPTGPILGSATIDTTPIINGATPSWVCGQLPDVTETAVFSPPITLSSNTNYAFYITISTSNIGIEYNLNNYTYADGRMLVNLGGGWFSINPGDDLAFRVFSPYVPSLVVAGNSWYSVLTAHHFSKDAAVLATFLIAATFMFFLAMKTPKLVKAILWLMLGGAFILTGLTTIFSGALIGTVSIVGFWWTIQEKGSEERE